MGDGQVGKPNRGVLRWVFPRRGRWHWAILRVAIAAGLLIVFRYHVLVWLVAGHNLVWKACTGSSRNSAGDVELLLRLREPGARMLVRIGEAQALARATQAELLPALLDIARSHPDPRARAHALSGLSYFWDERVLPAASAALADPDRGVRRAAAVAFRQLGDSRHLPALQKAAGSETDPAVQALLRQAARTLRPAPGSSVARTERATVRVAAIQFISALGMPELNRKRLEGLIREAARNGARIVVLPETAIQGYLSADLKTAWQAEGQRVTDGLVGVSPKGVAESVPGPSTEAFAKLSKELGIYLTVPILEVDAPMGRYYNTLCLVGPEGGLALHYRKLHPWLYAERGWAAAGDRGLQFIDTPYGRLGLLICYDIHFEPPRLKREKVDMLLYSICWVDREKSPWFHADLPRIAQESDMHIVGANWTVPQAPDWHGYGQSLVIERTGRILAQATRDVGEEIVYAELLIP